MLTYDPGRVDILFPAGAFLLHQHAGHGGYTGVNQPCRWQEPGFSKIIWQLRVINTKYCTYSENMIA